MGQVIFPQIEKIYYKFWLKRLEEELLLLTVRSVPKDLCKESTKLDMYEILTANNVLQTYRNFF